MLNKICTDLETSKKLKELGVVGDLSIYKHSEFRVEPIPNDDKHRGYTEDQREFYRKATREFVYKAYTLEQILEMLPKELNRNSLILKCWYSVQPDKIKYFTDNVGEYAEYRKEGENLATTAARLLIKLVEDKIIKIGE